MLRKAVQNTLLVLGSLLVFFLIGEGVCRLFFPDTRLRYAVDKEMIARFVPNQVGYLYDAPQSPLVRINELGLRGRGLSNAPEQRILFVGDSFTFGSGVKDNESFVALVDKALGDKVAVINGGQPGFGIYQMEILLGRLVSIMRPKLVVIVIWEYLLLRQPLPEKEKEQLLRESAWLKMMKSVSVFGTHVYRLLEHLALQYGERNLVVTLAAHEEPTGPVTDKYLHALAADETRLIRMDRIARSVGAKTVIVFWPRKGYLDTKETNLSSELSSELRKFSAQNAMEYLSLGDVFKPYDKKLLSIPHDGHPTAFGHCIVAEKLLVNLVDYGYRPTSQLHCASRTTKVSP